MAFMLAGAIGGVLLGLPYIFHAFGPTEAEVARWGVVCALAGIVLLPPAVGMGRSSSKYLKVGLGSGYAALALIQVPPIFLWLAFHGAGISDGTPPSGFVAHWGYALPHLAALIVCLKAARQLVRSGLNLT